ncbi:LysR family transcriptional regulator [Pigmentiphaga sp. H8]|uniref:LysR family transcriptional regulator n=1 Tax=unclassified Pigmentiphaga TaxID=2626614 RepID=UPI000F5AB61D|nr:LysR family transcriptional regulator [Pigmentiphaga sp. H8]AZG09082.1 LysR family transcriptional regulator [Pigmentiphaga sp. H8]
MDLRALRYFVEVVQRQSYTAAARALFVTQPTVSKMIRQLEDELGTPVLRKFGRRIEPTDTGRIVLERGRQLLALHAQLQAELSDVRQAARGELVVGTPPLAHHLLAPLLARFHQDYPGIELRLFERGSRSVEDELKSGTLEIGAMLLPADENEYETLPICNFPLRLIVPASSSWAGRERVRLEELAAEPFIFYGEGFVLNEVVHAACVQAGFTPRIAGRSSQWDFMASMVAAGVGLALLPELFSRQLDRSRLAVVPLQDPQLWWHMAFAWRRGRYLSFAARAWLDLARRMLPGDGRAAGDNGVLWDEENR